MVVDNLGMDPFVCKAILQSTYVDDLTKYVGSIIEVHKIITGIPTMLQTGGFQLTKFAFNDDNIKNRNACNCVFKNTKVT